MFNANWLFIVSFVLSLFSGIFWFNNNILIPGSLDKDGQETTASITEFTECRRRILGRKKLYPLESFFDASKSYFCSVSTAQITYQYFVNGKVYNQKAYLPKFSNQHDYKLNSTIRIIYSQKDPSKSKIR